MYNLKPFFLLLLLTTFLGCKDREEPKRETETVNSNSAANQLFPENSIGVAYLETETTDSVSLAIRFPDVTMPDSMGSVSAENYTKDFALDMPPQTITLFTQEGEIATLKRLTNCVSRFWCENDGGIKHQPTFLITVAKSTFAKTPTPQNQKLLGNICSFAIINFKANHVKTFYPPQGTEDRDVVMRGRLSNDYSGYAEGIQDSVFRYYDRNAQITVSQDESQMEDNCIMLQVFNSREDFEIGCCGP